MEYSTYDSFLTEVLNINPVQLKTNEPKEYIKGYKDWLREEAYLVKLEMGDC